MALLKFGKKWKFINTYKNKSDYFQLILALVVCAWFLFYCVYLHFFFTPEILNTLNNSTKIIKAKIYIQNKDSETFNFRKTVVNPKILEQFLKYVINRDRIGQNKRNLPVYMVQIENDDSRIVEFLFQVENDFSKVCCINVVDPSKESVVIKWGVIYPVFSSEAIGYWIKSNLQD